MRWGEVGNRELLCLALPGSILKAAMRARRMNTFIAAVLACGMVGACSSGSPSSGATAVEKAEPLVAEPAAGLPASSPGLTGDDLATAAHIDHQAKLWDEWGLPRFRGGQGEHGCLSCHTTFPYLLARPALREPGSEAAPLEAAILEYVGTRVDAWDEIEAWYTKKNARGDPEFHDPDDIERQSRATEAVLNAAVYALRAARDASPLPERGLKALANLWQLQNDEGPDAGGFAWINWTLAPWQVPEAAYWGSAIAALAVGRAPGGYAKSPDVAPRLQALVDYLQRGLKRQDLSLHNMAAILWASSAVDSLLDDQQIRRLRKALVARQRADGSFALTDFSDWPRRHKQPQTPQESGDAYATAMAVLALVGTGPSDAPALVRAVHWLRESHDPDTGGWKWPRGSLSNLKWLTPPGQHLMSDACAMFAVIALDEYERARMR